MASSCSLRHNVCKSSRILRIHLQKSWPNRSFALNSAADQQPAVSSPEEIVIPRKKTWSKEAVLQALASTVKRDPTASDSRFQDDPYLTPKTSSEFKLFSLSQESGRNAAKYFINTYPKYFQKDYAQPHIPCLMPETLEAQIEEASEAALIERIRMRRVKAAVDLYDQLLQAGTSVSLNVTNQLLDLICFCGDHDLARENVPEQRNEETEDVQDEPQAKEGRAPKASGLLKATWKENNNAERIFALLSEPNTHSYSALIRGMVKYGAYSKAFSTYTDMLNNRLKADVHTFNALITAAPEVKEKYNEKWELIVDLLKQMAEQKVKPNLLTLNAVLKALRHCGTLGKSQAFPVISEMKALSIDPSLASYNHLLAIFYKTGAPIQGQTDILQEVMNEVSGKSFTAQDPDDGICISLQRCLLTYVQVGVKITSVAQKHLISSGDTENIKQLGHANRQNLVEELLTLMAREKHNQEVQESFAECALDIKKIYDTGDRGKVLLSWTAGSLSDLISVLLAAHRRQDAWEMLKLFKTHNRVPSEELLNKFLTCVKEAGEVNQAVELVQISAGFCLPETPKLIQRVQQEFELTEGQRNMLSDLEIQTFNSN
ncbi:pentatricopeptide repeat domain-containing protein 3, mitochondrial-like [Sinocyclocheilus grahami]|uniref:pentatricopeptide repeat domain-containing protein 3, mitochondrial-like n=1 Tax=Sinocyclocheilus grahami TaxID=75366 RepID=UPI0007AD355B|nr:PREDICTED: pentatricopeptide repeat domain-containing protein 3, mitochondrial-like [Sinocyclocheilus grahami]